MGEQGKAALSFIWRQARGAGRYGLYLLASAAGWLLLAQLVGLLPLWLCLAVLIVASAQLTWSVRRSLARRQAETRRLGRELAARVDEIAARVDEKRRSEEKFSRIFHASPVTIVISRLESDRCIDVNSAFERQFGWTRAEAIGASALDIGLWPNAGSHARWLEALRRAGKLRDYAARLRTKAGELRDVVVAAEVFDLGTSRHVISLIHDVTELHRAAHEVKALNAVLEDRVRQRTAELTEANKELESFAYSISHDLRAPLRGIDGFSHLLADEYGDRIEDQGRGYLLRVRQAAQRMGRLIDDLLDLSRVNRRELKSEKVDLTLMALEVCEELRKSAPERRVEVEVGAGLGAVGDAQLLRVVLENLLGNAWKYTSRQACARIAFGRDGHGPGEQAFFVRDNGIGFDMAYVGKLFQPFQRLHEAQAFEGSGVGLASVARIVRRHRGRVWADSTPQAGSTFHFTLND